MGCRDLTDGVWVWPEGLVHYVEAHQLPLPTEFLETVRLHGGAMPEVNVDRGRPIDAAFWNEWFDRKTGAA